MTGRLGQHLLQWRLNVVLQNELSRSINLLDSLCPNLHLWLWPKEWESSWVSWAQTSGRNSRGEDAPHREEPAEAVRASGCPWWHPGESVLGISSWVETLRQTQDMLEEITSPILGMPQYIPEGAGGSAFITNWVKNLVFIYRTVFYSAYCIQCESF